jgi:hypothetical protein
VKVSTWDFGDIPQTQFQPDELSVMPSSEMWWERLAIPKKGAKLGVYSFAGLSMTPAILLIW